jgi:hypothetical protein
VADEYDSIPSMTLDDLLTGVGRRVKKIAADVPHEAAANLADLRDLASNLPIVKGTREMYQNLKRAPEDEPEAFRPPPGLFERRAPSPATKPPSYADMMRAKALREGEPSTAPSASVSETPFATHTGDLPAQLIAGIADPTNLLTAGGGGVITKAGARAATKTATEKLGEEATKKATRGLINLKLREMPEQDALAAALREQHLFPTPEGGYVGAPRNIQTRRQLLANRARMDREYEQAKGDIEGAGETVGDWYPSQRRGVAEIADPWQQRRVAQARGLFSSQTDPEGETAFMLQAWNRNARGEPVGIAHTGRQGTEFERSAAEGRDISLGQKTGPYAMRADPTMEQPSLFGINDFRNAQFHGYTEPSGKAQTTGLKPTQHAFIDAETALMVNRARARALAEGSPQAAPGAKDIYSPPTEVTGPLIQEVAWVKEKANALQRDYPKRFPKTPEGADAAMRAASKTGEDFVPKHAVGATYEQVPGRSLGHVPSILNAPTEAKIAYGAEAPWTSPTGRDVIYESQGLLQRPTTSGFGYWKGQTNPNRIAQPLGDVITTGKGTARRELPPEMHQQLALAENLRGLIDAQEAGAYHLPMLQKARTQKTHLLMPHDVPLTEQEMQQVAAQLPKGWEPSASPRGTMLMNFGEGKPAQEAKQIAAALRRPVERAGMESYGGTIPVYDYGTPGGGVATGKFLERAAGSPEASVLGMSESPAVRQTIAAAHKRDALRELQGEPVSEAVQKTRRFFQEADWAKAADMVKKGATPEQAVAKLGYNLKEMGYTKPQFAAILAGIAGGGYLVTKGLLGKKKAEQPVASTGGRTTADAFQQRQEAMDAVNEELQRQAGGTLAPLKGFEAQNKSRLDRQIEEKGG